MEEVGEGERLRVEDLFVLIKATVRELDSGLDLRSSVHQMIMEVHGE